MSSFTAVSDGLQTCSNPPADWINREGRTIIAAIHQPNYLPNAAFFHKIALSDVFISLDDVQYRRRSYINRNRIKTPGGVQWLTVPVCAKGQYTAQISQIIPHWDEPWCRTHVRTLTHNYRRAPFFDEVLELIIEPAFSQAEQSRSTLAELNLGLIRHMAAYLGLSTPFRVSSEFGVRAKSTERLVTLTRAVGAGCYLSGPTGRKYMDLAQFAQAQIEVRFSSHQPKAYPQLWGDFVPGLSMIDALFNLGRGAVELVTAVRSRA